MEAPLRWTLPIKNGKPRLTTQRAASWSSYGITEAGYYYLYQVLDGKETKQDSSRLMERDQAQAFVAYVLSIGTPTKRVKYTTFDDQGALRAQRREHLNGLFNARTRLTPYGRAFLALAFHHNNDPDRARLVLREILAGCRQDKERGTAWVPPTTDGWWHWWNSDIETNAWVLRALVAIDPSNELGSGLVQWLIDKRLGGNYWRSTRDTAQAVAALADHMVAGKPEPGGCKAVVHLDGKALEELTFTRDNFLALSHRFILEADQVSSGQHEITIEKTGHGALYYGCRIWYFMNESPLPAEANGISIVREYHRVDADDGQEQAKRPQASISTGARVESGDTLEVVLTITADNSYDYLAFEDRKPAGCEPVQLQSGSLWTGSDWVTVELRDDKVAFFFRYLDKGRHELRYRVRAEVPGVFRVLPATGFAMYAPAIRTSSTEIGLRIGDR